MPEYTKIACLGDSIANGFYDETGKGWVVRLLEKLNAQKPYGYYLNNFARSSDRSGDVFHKLCHSVIGMSPDILIIAIGTNDLSRWDKIDSPTNMSSGLQEEYWEKIIDVAQKNVKQIYVFGLIPVDESAMPFQGDYPNWWFNSDIQNYNSILEKTCRINGISFFNFYDGFADAGAAKLLCDGLHPTTEGHEWMAEFAFQKLKDR